MTSDTSRSPWKVKSAPEIVGKVGKLSDAMTPAMSMSRTRAWTS